MYLSQQLKNLVNVSVSLLGNIIQHEIGKKSFLVIEEIRSEMASIRELTEEDAYKRLKIHTDKLSRLSKKERYEVARAFTLMLELINACENAYRSHRLSLKARKPELEGEKPIAITYVLTAHPTEARAPRNIEIFHHIQQQLSEVLRDAGTEEFVEFKKAEELALRHLLEMAWKISVVRNRKPTVADEAEHIYSLLLRDEVIFSLLEARENGIPFFARTWVGGDKDGHPGVDETAMMKSFSLARAQLVQLILRRLKDVRASLEMLDEKKLSQHLSKIEKKVRRLKQIETQDAKRVKDFETSLQEFSKSYLAFLGAVHPDLERVHQLLKMFPALVVPLELREASDVLMAPKTKKPIAIDRMLKAIAEIAKGGHPRDYARGFIISMTESLQHIEEAAHRVESAFGSLRIPIIPLFEEARTLKISDQVISEMLSKKRFLKAVETEWSGALEIMVGYSDSAKEAGVLNSRLAIAEALPPLEKICEKAKVRPVFFHGSGGSVSRGGGSIDDQTAWWPRSALRSYKVTVQGEMIERSLASPEISKRQIEKILYYTNAGLKKAAISNKSNELDDFADRVAKLYREKIKSQEFLEMVEAATPYSYLNVLKIGSRPSKRTKKLTVSGLRAIPWVLCWTQTRILFPIWFGVGTAWHSADHKSRQALKKAYKENPVFTSYMKALGFTLAKVELPIWRLYLERSELSDWKNNFEMFEDEFEKTKKAFHEICDESEFLWFRPWLAESIHLRSPMIHPLNILQILGKESKDFELIRLTMTGISSGMLTTG